MGGAPTRRRGRSRYPTRSRNAGAPGAAPATFDPLVDVTWHSAFFAQDPDWTPPADGGAVSQWDDGSGNGRHATQGTGGAQPTYRAAYANLNGLPAVEFDGSADFLATSVFTVSARPAQPWSVVVVYYQASITPRSWMGITPSSSSYFGTMMSGTDWIANGGAGALTGPGATAGKHLYVAVGNGASSKIEVDGTSVATGTIADVSATRIYLGTYGGSGGAYLNGAIAFAGLYAGDVTGLPAWAALEAGFGTHYGITIS